MKLMKLAILIMAMCGFCMAQTKTEAKKPAEKSAMAHDHAKASAAPEMPCQNLECGPRLRTKVSCCPAIPSIAIAILC